MKLLIVLLVTATTIGCGGYGSSYNSMTGGAAPHISTLSPSQIAHGSASFTLNIAGSGFTQNSTVYWGTTAIAVSNSGYGSSTQISVTISSAMVANAGSVQVYVHTAGGNSNAMTFTIT